MWSNRLLATANGISINCLFGIGHNPPASQQNHDSAWENSIFATRISANLNKLDCLKWKKNSILTNVDAWEIIKHLNCENHVTDVFKFQ